MRFWSAVLCCAALPCACAELTVFPEHVRVDPFGAMLETNGRLQAVGAHQIALASGRGGYVSCQLAAVPGAGEYRIKTGQFPPKSGIAVEQYREWFHFVPKAKRYYPDALIPIPADYGSTMPAPDNKIAGQTVQAFWLDAWVPANAVPGVYEMPVTLHSGAAKSSVTIRVEVLPAIIPDEDAVAMDHNTYGTSWFAEQYPKLVGRAGPDFWASKDYFGLIHSYHRIFYEHRGVFHQLGYGHAGKVGPEFAPRLEGSGATKHVADWTLFDRHYGPLLDGSAFANTHRGVRPIPFVYLPINPEWPASFLWWGEPGYEREYVNVVSEMERHFREKGWTSTRFELFFNHKKRYKGFPWDGDEARFPHDYPYFREYARLTKLAVPANSPVKIVFRADVSWTMERQWKELAGVVNFWVCGGGMFGWYDYAPRMLKERGDLVWIYGGTPPVTEPLSHMTTDVLRPWIWGIDGFVRWLTTSPGPDPWFAFEGGTETLVYPGDRFGVSGPIPSMRLKVERNAIQDLALLNQFQRTQPLPQLRAEAARRFNQTSVEQWWTPRPALADGNPEEWSNADIDEAAAKNPKFGEGLDAGAWQRVREYVLELTRGAQ